MQDGIESAYVDGRPLHHLPSAQSISLEAQQSSVFVVDYIKFTQMTAYQIQSVFRDRHILVLNCPVPAEEFSLKTLEQFGSLKKTIHVQGI